MERGRFARIAVSVDAETAINKTGEPGLWCPLTVPSDFAQFFADHHGPVTIALRAVTGDLDRAAEATDEAFARAAARWERVRSMRNPAGWAYRVACNEVRRSGRRQGRERQVVEQHRSLTVHHDLEPDPDLWRAVSGLPVRQREAVVLRYVLGFTQREIAKTMRIAEGTVAATLNSARTALRQTLDEVPHV